MIICHTHKFIFVKTRKTGGSSLQHFLAEKVCNPARGDIVTGMSEFSGFNWKGTPLERPDGTAWGHAPMAMAWRILGDAHGDYFKFTVERNPWDKTVSNFLFLNKKQNLEYTDIKQFLLDDPNRLPTDYDKYASFSGKLFVTHVYDYENLGKVAQYIVMNCRKKDTSIDMFDPEEFAQYSHKSGYREDKPYTDYYDDESRDMVAGAFAREIRMFGFKFGA